MTSPNPDAPFITPLFGDLQDDAAGVEEGAGHTEVPVDLLDVDVDPEPQGPAAEYPG